MNTEVVQPEKRIINPTAEKEKAIVSPFMDKANKKAEKREVKIIVHPDVKRD